MYETFAQLRRLNADPEYRAMCWAECGQAAEGYLSQNPQPTRELLEINWAGAFWRARAGGFPAEPFPDGTLQLCRTIEDYHGAIAAMRVHDLFPSRYPFPPLLRHVMTYRLVREGAWPLPGFTQDGVMDALIKQMDGLLHKIGRKYYHPGQLHSQHFDSVLEESYSNAVTGLWQAVTAYNQGHDLLETFVDGHNWGLFSFLRTVIERKVIEAVRAETPEYDKEVKRLRMRLNRRGEADPEIRARLNFLRRASAKGKWRNPDTVKDLAELDVTEDTRQRHRLIMRLITGHLGGTPALSFEADMSPDPHNLPATPGDPDPPKNVKKLDALWSNADLTPGQNENPNRQKYGVSKRRKRKHDRDRPFGFADIIPDPKADERYNLAEQMVGLDHLFNTKLDGVLTERQSFVLKRAVMNQSYRQIQWAYQREFKVETSLGNIGNLLADAKQRVREFYDQPGESWRFRD